MCLKDDMVNICNGLLMKKPCDLSFLSWHIAADHDLRYNKYRLIYEQELKERINKANICRSNGEVGLISYVEFN